MAIEAPKFEVGEAVWVYRTGFPPSEHVIASRVDLLEGMPGRQWSSWYYTMEDAQNSPEQKVKAGEHAMFHRPADRERLVGDILMDARILSQCAEEITKG